MRTIRNLFFLSLLCMAAWRLELDREQLHPGIHPSLGSVLSQAKVQLNDVHAASGEDKSTSRRPTTSSQSTST